VEGYFSLVFYNGNGEKFFFFSLINVEIFRIFWLMWELHMLAKYIYNIFLHDSKYFIEFLHEAAEGRVEGWWCWYINKFIFVHVRHAA
jgi:hypothetical protein